MSDKELMLQGIDARRNAIVSKMKVLNQYNNGWCSDPYYYELKKELEELDYKVIELKESIDNE